AKKTAVRADTGEALEIISLDEAGCRLELKVGPSRQPLAAEFSLIPKGPFDDGVQRDAIARYAQAVIEGKASDYAAVTSILRKELPRPALAENGKPTPGAPRRGAENTLADVIHVVGSMQNSHLVIQGPPGT